MKSKPSRAIPFTELPHVYRREGDDDRPEVNRALAGGQQIECRMCHHMFNDKRPQCPACGTAPKKRDLFTGNPRKAKRVKVKREKKIKPGACVFCRRSGSKVTCPTCNQPAHKHCLVVHQRLTHGGT